MKISEFLKLVRFEHAIMLAIAVFIGESVVGGAIPKASAAIILSLLVPVFSEMASFALNDYLDIESDRINKKTERPLVRGTISPKFAFWFSWACFAISTVMAFFINWHAFAIAVIFNALAVIYNYKLKDIALAGNVYIALTMAIPFIFGNFVISAQLTKMSLILAMIGFISGLAREIVKSAQDMEGDLRARKASTLPILIGRKNALLFAIIFYIMFLPLSYLPFLNGLNLKAVSGAIVLLADFGIAYNTILVYKALDEPDKTVRSYLKKARNITLLALFLGLVGYLTAVI